MATSTVKKSVAATVSQWAVRNVPHGVRLPLSGAGSMPCSRRILAMVLLATVWPRFERAVIRKKENRPEAADYGRSNPRNQRRIDFLRSTGG